MDSIVSNKRKCYFCWTTDNLHRHHIFYGTANRERSEEYGCWVYLCAAHHNMTPYSVHFNKQYDLSLKRIAQRRFEERCGSREDFVKVFGRNYL